MSHIKKLIVKCLSTLMAILIVTGMGIPAYAASDSVCVNLLVSQKFINHATSEVADTFSYILTPLETGNPMPEQSIDQYVFAMKGSESISMSEIAFTQTGTYRYELKQRVENKLKGYTYDERVYTVEIYVTNAERGGLTAATVVYVGDNGKADQISFENSYRKDPTPTISDDTPKTGDNSNLTLWFLLLVISIVGLSSMVIMGKKRRMIK